MTTSVNPLDGRIRSTHSAARSLPLILGFDVCGLIVTKGKNVKGFKIRDRVIGSPSPFRSGANAELVAIDYHCCAQAGTLSDELKADYVLNYRTLDLNEAIMSLTEGNEALHILDTVGGNNFIQYIDYIARNGQICSILPVTIQAHHADQMVLKNVTCPISLWELS